MSKCSTSKMNVGDYLSETQYYKIIGIEKDKIHVLNERGMEFFIHNDIAEEGLWSANQYDKEIPVSRSELVEKLEFSNQDAFTVHFYKQPTEQTILSTFRESIKELINSSELAFKRKVKDVLKGEERTLVGYLFHSEPKMGRSRVIDLEVNEIRMVDHRTIDWLILHRKKYVVH